jgi:hypothetical protein
MVFGGPVFLGLGGSQAGDQWVEQTLFNGSRDLGVRQDFRLGLGEATGLRVEPPQARRIARRGAQRTPCRRQKERLS